MSERRKIVFVEPADYFPAAERRIFEREENKDVEVFTQDEGYEQELCEIAERIGRPQDSSELSHCKI